MSKKVEVAEVPPLITDTSTNTTYSKGKFLGKGGFAKCYELVHTEQKCTYAGKIISKTLMIKEQQRSKITQEIQIHRELDHKNVVGFLNFFEDTSNIYIILELCLYKSMMELHRRRKAITEPETRFYMKEILNGVSYLHQKKIIHRDLKLGNLFLSEGMRVKIGDFGLATKVEHSGEKKKTLCGTPNYIAPEILTKKGHSFEVDIWSIGCIMYTLLIGRPPFETNSLQETYNKIKKCDYKIASNISQDAKVMIMAMIQPEPKQRPKVDRLLTYKFITNGFCPASLPTSCLTMAPRFDQVNNYRKPLIQINSQTYLSPQKIECDSIAAGGKAFPSPAMLTQFDALQNLIDLRKLLFDVISKKPARDQKFGDEMSDPEAQPMVWVSKWVDYSDKYGFGYQLSDEGVGVMFNDTTKLIMLPNGINVHYIDTNGQEFYMTDDNYPPQYEKKMKLLSYFRRYMREHLIKAGANEARETDSMSRIPHLYQWCRSSSCVLMQLNNGTVQINFTDHTKIIMCPLMGAITYIDEGKSFRTFRFSSIERNGCSIGLYEKMRYAYDRLGLMIESESKLKS